MKLKNKLLPLVGIGAACAAVTPIALTSCSSGLVDLAAKYTAKITDIPGKDSWTKETTNSTYFGACATNPEIFIDDCYWSASYINNLAESYYSVPVDNEKISNLSFTQFGSDTESVGKFWTVSMERTFDLEIETNSRSSTSNTTATGSIKYVNAPVVAEYDSDNAMWVIRIAMGDESEAALWTYLWNKTIDSSIALNVDFHNVTTKTSTSGYETKIHSYKSYNLEVKNVTTAATFAYFVQEDEDYLQPFYELRIENFGYSHYLFNITELEE